MEQEVHKEEKSYKENGQDKTGQCNDKNHMNHSTLFSMWNIDVSGWPTSSKENKLFHMESSIKISTCDIPLYKIS